ncbi:MAG: hypothetical protein M1546_04515 [Chloroflexi bacterium]|nr:hypothetical protein [Chloroflexota bacterium]
MPFVEAIHLHKTLPCLAEPGKLIVIGTPTRTLDGLLPLVAAVAPNVISFNPIAGTLTLRRKPGFITFYPDRVMITQVVSVEEGLDLLQATCDLLNQCWEHRDTIQPVTTIRRAPRPLDIWALLPQTNCKRCGEPTCMAFACALLLNKQTPDGCPPMASDLIFGERKAQLDALVGGGA